MNNEIIITNHTPQDITIEQDENQLIFINGGGEVIGITDVKVNGVSVVQNNIAYVIVPTSTNQLINNSGFITQNDIPAESDPTVPYYVKTITLADINSWNNKQDQLVSGSNIKTINNTSLLGSGNIDISGGESYQAGTGINISNNIISNTITSYNNLSDLPTIPTKTSDLLNDNDFVSEDDLAEVAFTGSYNSLSDTPIIPSATSDLINDSNFVDTTDLSTALSSKQDTLVSGTNIKTINNNSLLGSGNISISGGTATDVQINGTSIVNNNIANIITESAYNSSSNKIATMSDINSIIENGSFTPEIDGNTTSATITYSLQEGRYQKIGKVIYYNFKIAITSINGGSGLIKIKGIPYLSNIDTYISNIGNVMCLGDLFGNNNIRTLWSAGNDLIISDVNNGIGGLAIANTTNTNYLYCTGSFMIN